MNSLVNTAAVVCDPRFQAATATYLLTGIATGLGAFKAKTHIKPVSCQALRDVTKEAFDLNLTFAPSVRYHAIIFIE